MSTIQNWIRSPEWDSIYGYIHEYQNLLYEIYSKHAVAFLTTYYHILKDTTIWEDQYLMDGAYEQVGSLQGIKRAKILLFPVYYADEVPTSFDGQEIGHVKENETTIVIPSSYGITPLPHDIIKFEQEFLRPTNDIYPLFQVAGVEIFPNTDKRYWKLKIEVLQSRTLPEIESQVTESKVFFDYDKTIHTLEDAEFLTKLMIKEEELKSNLYNLFDQNIGFYLM